MNFYSLKENRGYPYVDSMAHVRFPESTCKGTGGVSPGILLIVYDKNLFCICQIYVLWWPFLYFMNFLSNAPCNMHLLIVLFIGYNYSYYWVHSFFFLSKQIWWKEIKLLCLYLCILPRLAILKYLIPQELFLFLLLHIPPPPHNIPQEGNNSPGHNSRISRV